MGVKAKARTRANRKARKGVSLVFPMEGNNAAKVEARANQRAKEGKVAKERAKESIRKEKAMAVEAATTFVAFVEVMATGAMSVLTRMVSIRCLVLAVVLGKFKELPLIQQALLDLHQHVVPAQLQHHRSLCLPLQRLCVWSICTLWPHRLQSSLRFMKSGVTSRMMVKVTGLPE